MKKWECTVCGYIHEGDEPPEECPVCGVGKEYFVEVVEKEEAALTDVKSKAAETAETSDAGGSADTGRPQEATGVAALIMKHHLHPISVHTPNGVLPVAIVFLFLATAFGLAGFEMAAFFNLVFVLLTMPFVVLTGVVAWRSRYR